VPEFLGEACRPGPVAEALNRLLDDEGTRLEQLDAMALTMQRLGRGGEAPGIRAARSVLSVI
jgi:lipid-A-disaccharide synthase